MKAKKYKTDQEYLTEGKQVVKDEIENAMLDKYLDYKQYDEFREIHKPKTLIRSGIVDKMLVESK
jgi:hypothetical protein